ncbi:hypothetical protein KP509_13G095900 [Ceratopteris richardii]|uniref:Pentatricopeptide repeat-containing protein n=1 Tax=Ceratopteris richardii TaxID=49495 RepID=A0A8T2TFZ8_CERRI|nr:hypothetical protein KP509_13G095900 [Ceratopteris richardii]
MESGNIDDALYCYDQMHSDSIAADELTFVCCLRTCGNAGSLTRGEDIYSDVLLKGLECDDFVGNTVIDMYSKCGLLEEAEFLLNKLSLQIVYSWNGIITGYSQRGESQKVFLMFKRMFERTTASWNALIARHMESGNIDDALYSYDQMHSDSIALDELNFVCCLRTCGNAGSLTRGEDIYSDVLLKGLECDDFVGNTVIDMYSKCGLLEEAEFLLNKLSLQIVYSWNGIITGYSQRGESQKVFLMFKRMLAAEINPNTITFDSILNVCNHRGELSNGYIYYVAMGRYFDIIPVLQLITCIVDLLDRSGCVVVAISIINTMHFHPGLVI